MGRTPSRVWMKSKRKVQLDPKYMICGQLDETMTHILWECPHARNMWALAWGRLQKSNSVVDNFFELARQMKDRLSRKDLELWEMTT
ncbi:hypothetical protein SO802_017682 [Lithocarpus litseifolius]|uniref:Reverse transcriptase zinc-binding domain-containing protein n=1 Tax=Lithocarpus litseifolius TaxID=425828 RepID=A0AAW2CIQ3_9ROSI